MTPRRKSTMKAGRKIAVAVVGCRDPVYDLADSNKQMKQDQQEKEE